MFDAPWEARTFAMVRALRDGGVVSAADWTDALAAQLGDAPTAEVRYRHWLAALEEVLTATGVLADGTLQRYRSAWTNAAHRTPHGEPIELATSDFQAR